MKISENVEKITNPGFKKVVRFFSKETGKAMADVIMLRDEPMPDGKPYEIFDPNAVWKRKVLENYEAKSFWYRSSTRASSYTMSLTLRRSRRHAASRWILSGARS